MMNIIIALICGLLFGIGLTISGMTNPDIILGFLDVFGAWDMRLLFVLGGAVSMTVLFFKPIMKREKPFLAEQFYLPIKQAIDKPLIIGAIIFGAGWGLYGFCPGPAIAALSYGETQTILFVATMLVGMIAARLVKK